MDVTTDTKECQEKNEAVTEISSQAPPKAAQPQPEPPAQIEQPAEPAASEPAALEPAPEEETEDESDEAEEEHPLDALEGVIERIDKQLVRLENRNAGNLKFELANNVYPLLSEALRAIYGWISDVEADMNSEAEDEDVEDEELTEEAEAFQRSVLKESQHVLSICEKIVAARTGEMPEEDWNAVVAWAEETIRKVKPAMKEVEQ